MQIVPPRITPLQIGIQWIFAIICFLPLIEIAGFVIVGEHLGVLGTLAAVILNSIFGMFVLRAAGWHAVNALSAAREQGVPPPLAALDSFFLILAGFLFVIPGFATDLIGLPLLFPPIRHLLAEAAWRKLGGGRSPFPGDEDRYNSSGPTVIEGDFHEVDPRDGRR